MASESVAQGSGDQQQESLPPQTVDDEEVGAGRLIGSVISTTPNSPNFLEQHFRIRPDVATPRPGSMVAVLTENARGGHVLVLARVANAWEVNPHEDALSSNLRDVLPIKTQYAGEGSSTVIYRVASMEPLEEAELDRDGAIALIHEVETLPRAGASVFEASDELVIGALGLAPNPDHDLDIGVLRGSAGTRVALKKEVLQRHIFIAGGIGSGKSYTRGVLAEELRMLGVPQINIDVNGELVKATEELGGINLMPGSGFKLPLSAFTSSDVLNAVPSLNGNMIELVRHAHEELLKESRRTGRPFGVAELSRKIEDLGPRLEMKPVTVVPARGRVESLYRFKYLGEPYDWHAVLRPGALINIHCRGMERTDLRLITAAVCRDIQRLAGAHKIGFVVLSIDEFHLVAPKDEETVPLQVLRELARIGRHYRIGLILTTQSPSDVDRSILKRLLTRFLHAIESDQLDALRGVFSDASDDLIRHLPKLPQGVCVLTGAFETVRHAVVIEVRRRRTTHGGDTPDIFKELAAAGWPTKKPIAEVMGQE